MNIRIYKDKKIRMESSRSELQRNVIKSIIRNKNIKLKLKYHLIVKLSKMSRMKSMVRISNRCTITGRPKAVLRDFKLSRHMFKHYASYGFIPGLIKSSW